MAESFDESRARGADEIEDRLRKLETALEERLPGDEALVDRVIARLSALAAHSERNPESGGMLVLAASGEAVPSPPQGAVLHPPAPPANSGPRKWFLPNLLAELRLIATMYFDPRYRISRTTQFALPGILLVLIFNYFFFSVWVNITFVSPFVERVLAVIAGMLIYTLLIREVARYREVLAYLARYGR
jgi:hypothetical protein